MHVVVFIEPVSEHAAGGLDAPDLNAFTVPAVFALGVLSEESVK